MTLYRTRRTQWLYCQRTLREMLPRSTAVFPEIGVGGKTFAMAVRNVAERLYGQRKPRSDRDASVAVAVDHMLNEPAVYGFDGDGVDADDLANAITAACRDWEYYHFKHPDKLPDDAAHAFILKATRKAVTAILAGAYGQWCIEEELDYLREDA